MLRNKCSSGKMCESSLRRSRSQPSLRSERVDEQLRQLKPSKELAYYRKKMAFFAKEYQEMHKDLENCRKSCERDFQLQQEIQKRQFEISQLQETVSDLQVYLYQEREQVLRLFAENDRLKICLAEDRKKIQFLLALTSTTENDLSHFIAETRTPVIQQSVPSTARKTKQGTASSSVERCCSKSEEHKDTDLLILQNKALAVQLEEHTRLFEDHLQTLLRDRELQRKEAAVQHEQYQEKISSLSTRLKETQNKLCDVVKQVLEMKEQQCKNEVVWAAERDMLMQSLQNFQRRTGELAPSGQWSTVSGGGCTDHRNCHIIKADLESVKKQLSQREKVVAMYQEQCLLLDEELTNLRLQVDASKKASKEQSQKLLDLISVLKTKYNELDRRRRLEAEGFRSDVRLMRSRLREVERSLLRLSRGTTTLSSQNVEQDLFMTVADTVSKAQILEKEMQAILKKVSEMGAKCNKS